jgi:hypothetical protein
MLRETINAETTSDSYSILKASNAFHDEGHIGTGLQWFAWRDRSLEDYVGKAAAQEYGLSE